MEPSDLYGQPPATPAEGQRKLVKKGARKAGFWKVLLVRLASPALYSKETEEGDALITRKWSSG